MSATLISLIGPPAVGKTTLAGLLAADLSAGQIHEDFEGNPFLADSFQGRDEARLPAQLYYLLSRVRQLSVRSWPASGLFVSDYGFCQDDLFARVRLADDELAAYQKVAAPLATLVRPPDVLVALDAPVEVLLARLASRGRAFEAFMTGDFLESMRQEYRKLLAEATCPVVEIDTSLLDIRDAQARQEILTSLNSVSGGGRPLTEWESSC
ncbi:MAG: deoxynucleoside kinase [Planctomycetaceae bacterium]|nr:deoxynucleoside kinase [Planctomycetaceae bacterium]